VSSGRLLWAGGDTDLFVGSRHGNTYYFLQNEMTSSWPMFKPAAGTLLGFRSDKPAINQLCRRRYGGASQPAEKREERTMKFL
jgi:hypothetical protein